MRNDAELAPEEVRRLASRLMREQAALGLRVAAVFVLLLVGLPLANLYLPSLGGTRVLGFTLTWLLLGVLFYPVTWFLSAYFVRESDRIEARHAGELGGPGLLHPQPPPHHADAVHAEAEDRGTRDEEGAS
jgi:uncharacterized membrane protein (DUF485 family)